MEGSSHVEGHVAEVPLRTSLGGGVAIAQRSPRGVGITLRLRNTSFPCIRLYDEVQLKKDLGLHKMAIGCPTKQGCESSRSAR